MLLLRVAITYCGLAVEAMCKKKETKSKRRAESGLGCVILLTREKLIYAS